MKKITLLFLVAITMITTIRLQAQVRPDIYSFTSAERIMLVNAMMEYIDAEVVQKHCNHQMITGGHIHGLFDFLPFHRTYLERMEDYLLSKGSAYHIFVPLPKWDPVTCTPPEFQVIDPDCATFTCNMGTNTDPSLCNDPIEWDPIVLSYDWQKDVTLPYWLYLPVQEGNYNDLCDFDMKPLTPVFDCSPPSNCNGLTAAIADTNIIFQFPYTLTFWHSKIHTAMGGVMGTFRSPIVPVFWLYHAFVDDIWKTWECNCDKSRLDGKFDLYMKDSYDEVKSERDRGEEPNIDNGSMWISEDIWIRKNNDGFTNREHQNPVYIPGKKYYVYVQVRNRGCLPSPGGGQTLDLRWSKAGTSLGWPDYWDGSVTTPALMGDLIATKPIPPIQPGASVIIEFEWFPPNPANYTTAPHHFHLLARIVSAQDKMAVPEYGNVIQNIRNNNNIVGKSLSIN